MEAVIVCNSEYNPEVDDFEVENSYREAYMEIISKTADLLKDIKMDNPFDASLAFEYLLWNGYFSKDKKLKYSMNNRCLALDALGADIMRGYSVCLNNSDMLARVLEELNIPSKILNCYVDIESLPDDLRFFKVSNEQISKDESQDSKTDSEAHFAGNHAVTVFNYEDLDYVIDSTNLAFLEPCGYKQLNYLGTDDVVEIEKMNSVLMNYFSYNSESYELYSRESNEFEEILSNLSKQSESGDNKKLNKDFILSTYDKVLNCCINNTELFEAFHTDITPQIDTVCKTLKR